MHPIYSKYLLSRDIDFWPKGVDLNDIDDLVDNFDNNSVDAMIDIIVKTSCEELVLKIIEKKSNEECFKKLITNNDKSILNMFKTKYQFFRGANDVVHKKVVDALLEIDGVIDRKNGDEFLIHKLIFMTCFSEAAKHFSFTSDKHLIWAAEAMIRGIEEFSTEEKIEEVDKILGIINNLATDDISTREKTIGVYEFLEAYKSKTLISESIVDLTIDDLKSCGTGTLKIF